MYQLSLFFKKIESMARNMSLNSICVLSVLVQEDRYGLEIIDKVKENSNIKILLGSLYNILSKLERDGLLTSYWGEETADRGGNRRRYYRITKNGESVLNEVQYGLNNMWKMA